MSLLFSSTFTFKHYLMCACARATSYAHYYACVHRDNNRENISTHYHTHIPSDKQTSSCSSVECVSERLHCEIRSPTITSPLQLLSKAEHTHTDTHTQSCSSSTAELQITEVTFVPLSVQSHPNLISSKPPVYTAASVCFDSVWVWESERR